MEGVLKLLVLSDSFQRWLDEFVGQYAAARNFAPQTRSMYESDVRGFLWYAQQQGIGRVQKIERRHIEAFLADLDRHGYAAVTRRRKLSAFKAFFAWLRQHKVIAGDPTRRMIPPRYDPKQPRVLSQAEYQQLLSVIDSTRDQALAALILQTGIRLAEAHQLNTQDVFIPEPVTDKSIGTMWVKSRDKEQALVYLNAKACQPLTDWLLERPVTVTDAVFVSRNQRRLSRRQMQRLISKYVNKAGLSQATIKTLRHSFATHHLIKGTPIHQVKDCLGHKWLRSTEVYTDMATSLKARYIREHAL